MKMFQRTLLAMLLIAALLVTMAPALAETPNATTKVDVKITGMTGDPKVTLYKIVDATYGDSGLTGYAPVEGVTIADVKNPTQAEIQTIANGIKDGSVTLTPAVAEQATTGGQYTANVNAGMYLAMIEGATDGSVYTPVVLSAYWADKDSGETLTPGVGDPVDVTSSKLVGSTGVAKRSKPDLTKELIDGAKKDDAIPTSVDEDGNTVTVGSKLTYKVTPTLPDYPANAVNKTFYLKDEMESGLTFLTDSMKLTIGDNAAVTICTNDKEVKIGDTVVAEVVKTESGFQMWFKYDAVKEKGGLNKIELEYCARVNETAVVGDPGNKNTATLVYAKNPSDGTTYDEEKDGEPTGEKFVEKKDEEKVYTYELAFKKVDPKDATKKMEGAKFGIYSDSACAQLIDEVVTNAEGIAVSTKVKNGAYYIKELEAPAGYSLNTKVYSAEAKWTTVTSTVTSTSTETHYGTKPAKDGDPQVGWLDKNNKFYELSVYTEANKPEGVVAAYITSESTNSSTAITTTENAAGTGVVKLEDIPNTKMDELPSTGGTGGMMITVGGILAMLLAAFAITRMKKTSKAK